MRTLIIALLLLFGLLLGLFPLTNHPTPIRAQGATPPIYFLRNGDIYSYNVQSNTLSQKTTWGHNEAPIMSPDGTQFVYNSWASQYVDGLVSGNTVFLGSPPSNIWLWDIALDDAVRIAEQPANMVAPTTTAAGNGIIRSTPVWSPDGAQIAWTEAQLPDYGYRLVTYNLATDFTQVLVDGLSLGFQDAGVVLQNPTWGSGGIALERWDYGPNGFQQTLTVYHPFNGSIVYSEVVNSGETSVLAAVWLDDVENTLALAYRDSWELLNVATGVRTEASGVGPYSRLATSNTSLPINATFSESGISLQTLAGSITESSNIAQLHLDIAISPDGNDIAYIANALYVKRQNQVTVPVNGTSLGNPVDFVLNHGVIWGPVGWRQITNGLAAPIVNACSPIRRLTRGGRARVIAGQGGGNVLRSLPRTGEFSDEFALIPENSTMTVISGPVCQDGFNWWMVEYNNSRGWTPEGDSGGYWLEPIS